MVTKRKTLRGIKTMASLTDGRKSRTVAGAYLEMASLANERERLNRELDAALRRNREIRIRLADIGCKAVRLQKFIKDPALIAQLMEEPSQEGKQARIKSKEFSY